MLTLASMTEGSVSLMLTSPDGWEVRKEGAHPNELVLSVFDKSPDPIQYPVGLRYYKPVTPLNDLPTTGGYSNWNKAREEAAAWLTEHFQAEIQHLKARELVAA